MCRHLNRNKGDDEPAEAAAPGAADSPTRPDRVASRPTLLKLCAVPGAGDSSKKDMPAENILRRGRR